MMLVSVRLRLAKMRRGVVVEETKLTLEACCPPRAYIVLEVRGSSIKLENVTIPAIYVPLLQDTPPKLCDDLYAQTAEDNDPAGHEKWHKSM